MDDRDSLLAPGSQSHYDTTSGSIQDVENQDAASTKKKSAFFVGLVLALLLAVGAGVTLILLLSNNPSSLSYKVQADGVMRRLSGLLDTAKIGGLNSRSVLNNYGESLKFVREVLANNTECTLYTQKLVVPIHDVVEPGRLGLVQPHVVNYQANVDFLNMRYGGNGTITIDNAEVFVADNYGCAGADYIGMPTSNAVIVARYGGSCEPIDKALLVQHIASLDNGGIYDPTVALLLDNIETSTTLKNARVRFTAWKEGDELIQLPVFSISHSMGAGLRNMVADAAADADRPAPRMNVYSNTKLTVADTENLFCDSPDATNSTNVVVLGAHLDSVPEGPGMNDNGSGSAALLEVAVQYFRNRTHKRAVNPVRFAWWAAEEIGLLGARHYVRTMQESGDIAKIAAYMNFDMLGSPNGVPYIHNGTDVNANIPLDVQNASTRVQQQLESFFVDIAKAPYSFTHMQGGSDYLPFIEAGVPSSGMATGASGLKTEAERTIFGGDANAPHDACYHLPCDTLENINVPLLEQCARAAAHAGELLAVHPCLRHFLQTGEGTCPPAL
ncbi:hypothetical protein H696_05746 [Fonticula alba]|uniref:Peptidase M28 domain-containing protein n=1 Tax=Fonticula alba TaxID=691883 RepID=A0A058Z0K7_FONAL|nr:hypothetical protein H696_05746 [Fonticula alba]KCV67804.1 hypothetical protein H696_05746 [Fonticula alba]|eukprot:XP_009497835.1 hypothetical protein H696_05746 [Fonticula alba]